MRHPVHNTGCKKGNPRHLDRPDRDTNRAKQQNIQNKHDGNPDLAVRIDMTLHPVVRRALAITLQCFRIATFFLVIFGSTEQYPPEPFYLWTVWIIRCFNFCMMLAMNGCPFFG